MQNARRHGRRAFADRSIGSSGSSRLEVAGRLLAALGHHVVADLLTLDEGAQPGTLDGADVHEHILAAVARLDESKPLLGVEELHGTCGHKASLLIRMCEPATHTLPAGVRHPSFGS